MRTFGRVEEVRVYCQEVGFQFQWTEDAWGLVERNVRGRFSVVENRDAVVGFVAVPILRGPKYQHDDDTCNRRNDLDEMLVRAIPSAAVVTTTLRRRGSTA